MSDALTEARTLSVEFGATLANHAAMVLLAQRRLGGTEADARRFLDSYRRNTGLTPPQPSQVEIRADDWTVRLGDRTAEAAYRAFFRAELARFGAAEALARHYLPRLLPGIAASALHALMRLAYAWDSRDQAEVAEALGYWAATYLPLGEGTGAASVTPDPAGVLARIGETPALRSLVVEPDGLLWHAMRQAASVPDFAPVHDWLAVGPETLRLMARDSLLVFAATMEFCALHAVTGTHWLRLILPLLGPADQARAIRFFWQAIASVYPKMGFPAPLTPDQAEAMRGIAAPEWDAIAAAARASDDEHDISLAWSARCEEQQWGDPLYRVVAARRLGLLPAAAVDRAQFEAELARDGYAAEERSTAASSVTPEHTHPFDVRALVLDGEITLLCHGERRTYRVGEVFRMAADRVHVEEVGPQGVRSLIGRLQKAA